MKIRSKFEKTEKKYQFFFNSLNDTKQFEIIENEIFQKKKRFF